MEEFILGDKVKIKNVYKDIYIKENGRSCENYKGTFEVIKIEEVSFRNIQVTLKKDGFLNLVITPNHIKKVKVVK